MVKPLCILFKDTICKTLPTAKQEVMQSILNSMIAENITETQFFVEVRNSLEIPIHIIEVGKDDEKKLNTYQYFNLGLNEWTLSHIEELLNVEAYILLYKLDSTFDHLATFTNDSTYDTRIILFLRSKFVFMVQIGIDLLMQDLESSKFRYMCENINVYIVNSYGKRLFQILHENDRNDVIKFLVQNECIFSAYPEDQKIPLVERRLKSNKEFHEYIKTENLEGIVKFLEANPDLRYINNEHNESACAVAIKKEKFKLYSFLYERNLTIRNYESNLLDNKDFLCFFRNQKLPHERYFDKLLQKLSSATFIVNKSKTNVNVDNIYKRLIQIPKFDLILNILFKIKPLFIIIDYQEKNISKICPYVCGQIRGLYDPQLSRIFISGGGGTEQILGTFAHEFTHFTMDLLYNNTAKPYHSGDEERQKDYSKIEGDIYQKVTHGQIKEEIIQLVYNGVYLESQRHVELVVRVNHILAYYGYEKGTQILYEEAPELFKFYNDKIVPDLEKYLRTQVNRNDHLYNPFFIQGIERKCKEYKFKSNNLLASVTQTPYHVVIETNCVHLTCMKLFSNITATESVDYNLNNTYMINLKTLCKNTKLAFSYFQTYELLIVADEALEKQSDVNAWTNIKDYVDKSGKRFIFIIKEKQSVPFKTLKYEDIFKWTDFDERSQKLIFNKLEINFQGNKIKFSELIDYEDNSHVLNKMLSIEMIRNCIFCKSLPMVGTKLLSNSVDYIERELITTIFELDELADGKIYKYNCENIADDSDTNNFNLILNNKEVITFPGKKIQKDKESAAISLDPKIKSCLRKLYDPIKDEIFIFSSKKRTRSSIFIDYDKEIYVNDFSYADMQTFSENKSSFNVHWFMESDEQDYLFYHLKTFGSLEKVRNKYKRKDYKIDERELFEKLAHQKISLIAATAGMGKTETIKSLAQRLVRNNPSTWAPVVILSRNTKLLDLFDAKNSDLDKIFDFMVEFLYFNSNLEKEMFKFCCNKKDSNVYLFLDGADEISPTYTKKIYKLIDMLSKTNIKRIIVSVRLNLKTEFENRLSTVAIELKPLTYEDQIMFMSNIWRNQPIHNIDKISRRVIKQFRNFHSFLNNPLQIVLVEYICREKLSEFSKKLKTISNFFANETTLMEVYAKFIDQKLKIAMTEKMLFDLTIPGQKKQAETYKKDTKRHVKHAAIITLLDDQRVKLFLKQGDIDKTTTFLNEVENLETYEGIVDGIISGKLNFVHRTYAEYFFADFLINDWKDWRIKEGEYFFFDGILVKIQFAYLRKFLNSYSGTSDFLSPKLKYYQVPNKLHGAVFQNIEENNLNILKCLDKLGFNITIKPSTMISNSDHMDFATLANQHVDTITYLVRECGNVHLSIYELARLKLERLYNTLPYKCIELIKALVQCELIDLDKFFEITIPRPAEELRKLQARKTLFQSLWDEVKDMAKTEDVYVYEKLFQSFIKILQ